MLRIISRNSRTPDKVIGDVQALVAGVNVIARRVEELQERFGADAVARCAQRDIDDSERRMRASLAELPSGRYEGSFTIDSDGVESRAFEVRVAVTLDGAGGDRRRLRGDVAPGEGRDQLVGVADAVGHRLRHPLLRRPDHRDERGVLPTARRAPAAAARW